MTPLGHVLMGYLVAGPAGVVVSLTPDLSLAIAHVIDPRTYPDDHPVMVAHAFLHSIYGVILSNLLFGWPLFGLEPWQLPLCWLLHLLTAYITHPRGARWRIWNPGRSSS